MHYVYVHGNVLGFSAYPLCFKLILTQETDLAFVLIAQNVKNTFALIVIFTFTRACTIALVVRASGIPSQALLAKNDGFCDFISSCSLECWYFYKDSLSQSLSWYALSADMRRQ